MSNKIKNKKAQVGGTLTWFIATVIIVFILLIGVYAASILGKTKFFETDKTIEGDGDSVEKIKSELAFEKNNTNKDIIVKWLNNKSLSEDS
ncbi:MAG TPA: hypothetical protein VJ912_00790 [Candidatus Nanoarchaeia archaeon]|nr:hypothetical protein [Candidatus Nanoarchaeia archaeon]